VFLEPENNALFVEPVLARQKRRNFSDFDLIYTNRTFRLAVFQEISIHRTTFKLCKSFFCSGRRSIGLWVSFHQVGDDPIKRLLSVNGISMDGIRRIKKAKYL